MQDIYGDVRALLAKMCEEKGIFGGLTFDTKIKTMESSRIMNCAYKVA